MKALFTLGLLFFSAIAICQTTIVLQPGPSDGDDAIVSQNRPSQTHGNYLAFLAQAWTFQGIPGITRSVIRFDLSSIPDGATILEANLSLYFADDSPDEGHTGNNAAYLRRVTSDWDENGVTWNNQPSYTTNNQVYLPESTTGNQDYENINVTSLMKDILDDPSENNGLIFMLENEDPLTSMLFYSSDGPYPALRPRLEITYTTEASDCITLQPGAEGKDAVVWNQMPELNIPDHQDFVALARTRQGNITIFRSYIEFDLSQLPDNSELFSATMSLYHNPTSPDVGHENDYTSVLQRVIDPWEENTVTWNNQPAVTTTNEVIIPATSSLTQDYPNIDVTNLVLDMLENPQSSHGFKLTLVDEVIFRSMKFASSDYSNSDLHPKLELCYLTNVSNKEIYYEEKLVHPNPFNNYFSIDNVEGRFELKLSDSGGRIVYALESESHGESFYVEEIENLPAGIYFLNVRSNAGNYFSKVVKAQ